MKRTTLMPALAVALIGVAGQAQAAQTDSISVTVSLQEVVSVSITPGTWNIGPVALSSTTAPSSFTATVGNTVTQVEILSSNGAGLWTVGDTVGLNQFVVAVASPAMTLTNLYQVLAASVPAYGNVEFALSYSAPSSDDKGAGLDQSFSVTLKASTAP